MIKPAILTICLILAAPLFSHAETSDHIHLRSGLPHSAQLFKSSKKGHVAFMGGSITQMNGYRPMIMEGLEKRFPDTAFTFTSAGLSSTCSTTGAFRLKRDVLQHGPVDLFFLEFAVNDDQDAAHSYEASIQGMEGIIRHVRRHNPKADIVVTYFVNDALMDGYRSGTLATSIRAHEAVTKHYQIPTINLAHEIQEQIDAGSMTWKEFGGVHPKPFGNRHCADMHEVLMDQAWTKAPESAAPTALPAPILKTNFEHGDIVAPKSALPEAGWSLSTPDWKKIPGSFRSDYAGKPCLMTTTPGAVARLKFEGSAVGAFVLAGPDAGTLESRIDDGEWNSVQLYHRYSKGLHYPRSVMFASGLKHGKHELEIRLAEGQNPNGKAPAARLLYFGVH